MTNWYWLEEAKDSESFDYHGEQVTKREACCVCYGTGVEYGETCVTCGGLGWVPVKEDKSKFL